MKVNELREAIKTYGEYNVDQLSKAELEKFLSELQQEVTADASELEELESTTEATTTTTTDAEMPPMHSPQWSDYVFSKAEPDELCKDEELGSVRAITTDGLRRLTELLIGDIVSVTSEALRLPNSDDGGAVVQCTVRIIDFNDRELTYSDLADVNTENTAKQWLKFAVSTAATRAEGRCLRKALRLRKILSAEEITTQPKLQQQSAQPGEVLATREVKLTVQTLAKSLNCNLQALLLYKGINSLDEMPQERAEALLKYLNKVLRNEEQLPTNFTL